MRNGSLMAAAEIPNTLNGKEKQTAAAILADSYTDGYELVMYCCAVAALLWALPVILWWRGAGEKVQVREIRTENLRQKRPQLGRSISGASSIISDRKQKCRLREHSQQRFASSEPQNHPSFCREVDMLICRLSHAEFC